MNPSKRYHYKYFKILERMVVTLAHTHTLSDPDSIFTIDPTTREITTTESKIVLMQYDHNSEIFTFQIPRLVEGHDMSLCNKIEIHYTNINRRTKEQSKDVYPVTDQKVEGDNLVFTWLLSGNATKYAGTLNFIIRFGCLEEDNTFSYMWHTDIFKNVTVSDGISNTESVAEYYSDILEIWKTEIIELCKDQVYTKSEVDTELDQIKSQIVSDDHINELIDSALGGIENGTY